MIRVGISTGAGAWSTDELIGDHEIAFGSEIVKNRVSSYTVSSEAILDFQSCA